MTRGYSWGGYWLTSPLTLHDEEEPDWLSPTKPTCRRVQGTCFFSSLHALLSWGSGSGFCIIFQSSTSIPQPWYPTVTVTDWQDATFDCHVLYSTEPFSSRGCHQGSTSTGIAVLSVGVCLYMCATHKHSRFFFFSTCTRRLCKQHEFPVCGRVLLAGCYTWYLDSQSSAVVQVAAHDKLLKHSNT